MKTRSRNRVIFIALIVILIACLYYPLRGFVEVFGMVFYMKRIYLETDRKIASLSDERLDELLQDCEKLASTMTNEQTCTRWDKNIPSEFADLDPSGVYFTTNKVMIEFMGGLAHNGIVARKGDSGTWSLYHYDDRSRETRIK